MVTVPKKLKCLERGSLIKVSFDPILGHEQAGYRPALVLSSKTFYQATGFALCVPITSKQKGLLFEVEIVSKNIKGVALPHGTRMLDLTTREFSFVEMAKKESLEKAQAILTSIITA
jgi:mRNA interferase MazF